MSSTIAVPNAQLLGNYPPAIAAALVTVATQAKADIDLIELGGVANATKGTVGVVTTRVCRGVVTANVASLAAFAGVTGGTAFDTGVTCVAGDVVLLVGQTTAAQNGPYVVGTVATGTAPLTRLPDCAAASAIEQGTTFEVGFEGTLYGGSTWKTTCTGVKVWGTDDPLLFPRKCSGVLTLSSGSKTLGSADGLFVRATTCPVHATLNTPGGTLTTTIGYHASARTAGTLGTAALTIIAHVAAGSVQSGDTSTVDWSVQNW